MIKLSSLLIVTLLTSLTEQRFNGDLRPHKIQLIQECCIRGKNAANGNCEHYFNVPEWNLSLNRFCSAHFRSCCYESKLINNCELGKQEALNTGLCAPSSRVTDPFFGQRQTCCYACSLGVKSARSNSITLNKCYIFQADKLEDRAFVQCCNNIAGRSPNLPYRLLPEMPLIIRNTPKNSATTKKPTTTTTDQTTITTKITPTTEGTSSTTEKTTTITSTIETTIEAAEPTSTTVGATSKSTSANTFQSSTNDHLTSIKHILRDVDRSANGKFSQKDKFINFTGTPLQMIYQSFMRHFG